MTTPESWRAHRPANGVPVLITGDFQRFSTKWTPDITAGGATHPKHRDEVERTLNIMAAAPDLLAACKAALSSWITPNGTLILGSPLDTVQTLRAAIARAEGRQS